MRASLGLLAALVTSGAIGLAGCAAGPLDGLDTGRLPGDLRADYWVFTQRCSKCHSLARTLGSGIDDDQYWSMYVARMRRQPASGISGEDSAAVLRFLHYFSVEERRRKGKPLPVYMRDGPALPAPEIE